MIYEDKKSRTLLGMFLSWYSSLLCLSCLIWFCMDSCLCTFLNIFVYNCFLLGNFIIALVDFRYLDRLLNMSFML